MVDSTTSATSLTNHSSLDELCLPTLSSQVGRTKEWTSLLNAYRRAAGVPDATAGAAADDATWNSAMDGSLLGDHSDTTHASIGTSSSSSINQGCQIAVVKGNAGTGKSFLVHRLKKCIVESFQYNFGHPQQAEEQQRISSATSYHDDTTISTKSGGFLNRHYRDEDQQAGEGMSEELHLFSELPTGLFAHGSFTHTYGSGNSKSNSATNCCNSPFAAFTESFNGILEQLIYHDLVDLDSLRDSLLEAVGNREDTLKRLATIVPNLEHVLLDGNHDMRDRFDEDITAANMDRFGDGGGGGGTQTPANSRVQFSLPPTNNNPSSHRRRQQIANNNNKNNNSSGESSLLSTDSPKGMRFLLKSFLKALARIVKTYYGGPIVIFLDDAECMDPTSAQLLSSLSSETEAQNLLIVLAVRSEALQQDDTSGTSTDHVLAELITDTLPQLTTSRYTEISIDNLTAQQVHVLVAQAMRRRPPSYDCTGMDESFRDTQLRGLVDLIYQRTHGNCFFVVQLLRSLYEKNLVTFDFQTLQWVWQIEHIQQATSISDNVLCLVADKIQTLSREARYVLIMASCLHSTIQLEVLAKMVLGYYPQKWDTDSWVSQYLSSLRHAVDWCPDTLQVEMDVLLQLDVLVACGLMERVQASTSSSSSSHNNTKAGCGRGVFQFAHERIRQAAQSLIPSQELAGQVFHTRVGELLRERVLESNSHTQTWMLFACLDHLNKGPTEIVVKEHQLEMVQLNRQAAEKAVALSAFLPASTYYAAAIDLLKQDASLVREHWVLLVQLRTQLSICYYRTGNLTESETVAKLVLASGVALQDKLPLYYNLIAVYKAQGNLEEAVNIGMDLLNRVGERFSKKPTQIRIAMEKQKVQKLLSKKSEEQLTNLPRCYIPLKGAAVNVYAILFGPMFHLGCPAAVDLLRLRSIYLTLKYGSTDASALAVAYYASHLISQGDVDGGYQFGKLSMELLKQSNTEELTSRTILVANFLSLHWKDPLSQTLDRLMKGYTVGMMNGDIEMAFTNAGLYQTHYYYSGLPLNVGEKDLRKFIKQMEEYGQKKELSQYKPLWQTMLNLMGRSKVDPTVMTGDAMDQMEFEQGKLGVVVMKSYRMQLAYYFQNLELAQSLMDELRPHSNSFVAPFFQVARRFFFALIRMGLARKAPATKRPALLKKINKEDISWLEVRVRRGAINCLHKLLILKAEMATFDSSPEEIEQAFNKAVVAAGRSGFSQDEALANELGAAHFLSSGNFPKASDYLTRAYELYGAWGARGKVKQLEEKYVLIKPPGSVPSGGGAGSALVGRKMRTQRFSERFSNFHKGIESSGSFNADNPAGVKLRVHPTQSLTSITTGSLASLR